MKEEENGGRARISKRRERKCVREEAYEDITERDEGTKIRGGRRGEKRSGTI